MPEILNELAVKHDASVAILERSLQDGARTRFWVDVAAMVTCLAAFVGRWHWPRTSLAQEEAVASPVKRQGLSQSRRSRPGPETSFPVPEPHNGSFPDGGYAC